MYFSLSNIKEFGNYTQNISSSDEKFNITYFDENSAVINEEFLDNSQRNELIRKEGLDENIDSTIDLAEYSNQSIVTDVIIDDNDINLSLVPVYATMLFSGIPVPESKPIPDETQYEKSVILSIKSKKTLFIFSFKPDSGPNQTRVSEHVYKVVRRCSATKCA